MVIITVLVVIGIEPYINSSSSVVSTGVTCLNDCVAYSTSDTTDWVEPGSHFSPYSTPVDHGSQGSNSSQSTGQPNSNVSSSVSASQPDSSGNQQSNSNSASKGSEVNTSNSSAKQPMSKSNTYPTGLSEIQDMDNVRTRTGSFSKDIVQAKLSTSGSLNNIK